MSLSTVKELVKVAKNDGKNCLELVQHVVKGLKLKYPGGDTLEKVGEGLNGTKYVIEFEKGGVVEPSKIVSSDTPSNVLTKDGVYLVGWVDSMHSGVIVVEEKKVYYGDQVADSMELVGDVGKVDAWFSDQANRWWKWAEKALGVKPKARTPLFKIA